MIELSVFGGWGGGGLIHVTATLGELLVRGSGRRVQYSEKEAKVQCSGPNFVKLFCEIIEY